MKNNRRHPTFIGIQSARAALIAMLCFASAPSAHAWNGDADSNAVCMDAWNGDADSNAARMDALDGGVRSGTDPAGRTSILPIGRTDSLREQTDGGAAEAEDDTTEFESIRSTPYEQAALIGANALLVPLAIGAAAVSFMPPSFEMVVDGGVSYAAIGFGTGIGLGTKTETGRFADERLMINYTHVYDNHRHDLWRIEAVKDLNFGFVDRRHILAFGVSPLAGVYTDGPKRGYSLGASVRLMLPSLPYVGMFPLHTIGIAYRYNHAFNGGEFHTIALGFSAAVIF